MFPLHEFVLPGGRDKHPLLYVRSTGNPVFEDSGAVFLRGGDGFATDTYFGTFPLGQWRRIADLTSVVLSLHGTGEVTWALKGMTDGDRNVVVAGGELSLAGDLAIELHPASFGDATALYLEVKAASEVRLDRIALMTKTKPVRRVDLGLVITTFGRAELVRDIISNLERFLARDPERVLGTMTLTVVDNGRELDPAQFPGSTVLPNRNLGGAGGFARGLSHLTDVRTASHACFMDDDASTEAECLLRIRRLLAFARDERTAVSGAMLRTEMSFMMHEQGALIEWGRNHRILSLKNGLDLRDRRSIARVLEPEAVGYGGWWLFAFPILPDLRYPYPMFVRGDDWLFSYLNAFSIETSNGVCSWQEGFENKIGPSEQYLAFKAFLVVEIILRPDQNRLKTVYFFLRWIMRNLLGYCYDRAAMNCEALADTLVGPTFWGNNVALGGRLGSLRSLVTRETYKPLTQAAASAPMAQVRGPEGRIRKMVRLVTLNGYLVPLWFARRLAEPAIAVARVKAPEPILSFLREGIFYRDDGNATFFFARKEPLRFLRLLFRSIKLLVRLALLWPKLRGAYLASVDHYCTKEWWDQAFKTPS